MDAAAGGACSLAAGVAAGPLGALPHASGAPPKQRIWQRPPAALPCLEGIARSGSHGVKSEAAEGCVKHGVDAGCKGAAWPHVGQRPRAPGWRRLLHRRACRQPVAHTASSQHLDVCSGRAEPHRPSPFARAKTPTAAQPSQRHPLPRAGTSPQTLASDWAVQRAAKTLCQLRRRSSPAPLRPCPLLRPQWCLV